MNDILTTINVRMYVPMPIGIISFLPFFGFVSLFCMGTHVREVRDLGCPSACHSNSVQKKWDDLLTQEERNALFCTKKIDEMKQQPQPQQSSLLEETTNRNCMKFVPERQMNPERIFLETLRLEGKLEDDDDDDDDDSDEEEELTFPSLEGFFGQNTDYLYYNRHMKLHYSPFLAKCVQSYSNWKQFFITLFLGGGTIPDALSLLNLDDDDSLSTQPYVHVRSVIQQTKKNQKKKDDNDDEDDEYVYKHRKDGEHYITYPYLPFIFYLYAKGSSPPRTWSSMLYSKLMKEGEGEGEGEGDDDSGCELAQKAQEWILEKIHTYSTDPKGSDDIHCGGEWFEAYLHAVYPDIYNDIDTSDPTILLQKNKMKSLTNNKKKYNTGKLTIPNCEDGFDEIIQWFQNPNSHNNNHNSSISPKVEVMAKILIDIWMSCLVDFSTILKIGELLQLHQSSSHSNKNKNNKSKKKKIVIVCYMGTAHIKTLSEFFIQRMRFQRKQFIGKYDWDEQECRTLTLPPSFWNCNQLFS